MINGKLKIQKLQFCNLGNIILILIIAKIILSLEFFNKKINSKRFYKFNTIALDKQFNFMMK